MDYRHEMKFLVSDTDLEVIRYRLKPLMRLDEHQTGSSYLIRSLYFDDYEDSCMRENEDGIDNRRKYRIRIYDGSDEIIKLEKKIKYRNMTRKISAELTKEKCLIYMNGDAPPVTMAGSTLEKELYAEIKMNGMCPKVLWNMREQLLLSREEMCELLLTETSADVKRYPAFLTEHYPLFRFYRKGSTFWK